MDLRGQRMAREMALDLVTRRKASDATVWLAWRSGDVELRWGGGRDRAHGGAIAQRHDARRGNRSWDQIERSADRKPACSSRESRQDSEGGKTACGKTAPPAIKTSGEGTGQSRSPRCAPS